MTEAMWQARGDWEPLMTFLQHHPHAPHVPNYDRKLRLFVCGCCRLLWDVFPHDTCRRGVVVAEEYADGLVGANALAEAHAAIMNLPVPEGAGSEELSDPVGRGTIPTGPEWWAQMAAYYVTNEPGGTRYRAGETLGSSSAALHAPAETIKALAARGKGAETARVIVELFRDVIGNPFRPVTLDPAWRTPTAVALARQMYESRDFSAMPILADALQDAGCESADILEHCRGPNGVHTRGCWVVDLVLGKA